MFKKLCLLLFLLGPCYCQDVVTETSVTSPVSSVICETCNCTNDVVDCRSRDIRTSFTQEDWEGISYLNPTEVDLSGNPLTTISRFSALPIRTLNISNCGVEMLENGGLMNLMDLVSLDLSRNKISTSSISRRTFMGQIKPEKEIKKFESLKYLSLAYNDIHSLPNDIFFFMSDIRILDLSGNPLSYIDQVTMASLSELTKLTELYLGSCEMESLPEGLLRRQRSLKTLDLSGNRFKTVPATIGEAANLEYLNFNKNPIENITQRTAISNLTRLKELHLSRLYNLKSIGAQALGRMESLEVLHICYNPRLSTIDPSFLTWVDDEEVERWPPLKKLYLNNNNITEISSEFLDCWNELEDLDFTNNPYQCDCSTQWMVDVLVPLITSSAFNNTIGKMICKKPKEMYGMSLLQLQSSTIKLKCLEFEKQENSDPTSAIMLGIMIGVFATFPLVLVLIVSWKRGYFAKCRAKAIRRKSFEEDELYSYGS